MATEKEGSSSIWPLIWQEHRDNYWPDPIENGEAGITENEAENLTRGFHGGRRDLADASGNPSDVVSAASERINISDEETRNHRASPKYFVNYIAANPRTEDRYAADIKAENEAWSWAMDAGPVNGINGRPRVYKGEAMDFEDRPIAPDSNLVETEKVLRRIISNDNPVPMAAGAFKVTDTLWTPPPQPGKTVQGTLPHINWNQFGAPNVQNPEDVSGSSLTIKDAEVATERRQAAIKKAADHNIAESKAAEKAKKRNAQFGFMG